LAVAGGFKRKSFGSIVDAMQAQIREQLALYLMRVGDRDRGANRVDTWDHRVQGAGCGVAVGEPAAGPGVVHEV
jgi:hypothetical protein